MCVKFRVQHTCMVPVFSHWTLVYRTLNSTAASTDLADHGILIFMICDLLKSLLFL